MEKVARFALVAGVLLAGCGPAPGYGADGHMLPTSGGYYYDPNAAPPPQAAGPTSGGAQPVALGGQAPAPSGAVYRTPSGTAPTPTPAASSPGITFTTPPNLPPPTGDGAQPIASDEGEVYPTPSGIPPLCHDTCRFAGNGECDDGRTGSDTDLCTLGTDCADCGSVPR